MVPILTLSAFLFYYLVNFDLGSAEDELYKKFHQTGYKLRDVRWQLMSYDKDVFNVFIIKAFKYNRTTTAHNVTMNFKIDAKDDIEELLQGYKFLSNEYRRIALRLQVNLKKAFDFNVGGLQQIRNCGNLTTFYFYKDVTYHVCNIFPDETHFPPLIPSGKYKIEGTLLYFNKEVALIAMFGEVYTPIKYPKH